MQDYSSQEVNIDYVFFLAHGQDSQKPSEEEKLLTQSFIELIQRNKIASPIVLILSAGSGSEHLNSRIYFNEQVKSKLNNRVIEIKTSVIASPGSISYEIPYRCVKKLRIIPAFPWYDSKVSLAKVEDILAIFEKIIEGDESNLYYPPNYTTTYGAYIKKIATENKKQVSFLKIPFNEFFITPIIVSWIIGLPYYLIRNLMKSLAVASVIKES